MMFSQAKIKKFKSDVRQFESELPFTTGRQERLNLKNKIFWRKLDVCRKEIEEGLVPTYRLYDYLTTEEKREKITAFKKDIQKLQRTSRSHKKIASKKVQIYMREKKIVVLQYELNHPLKNRPSVKNAKPKGPSRHVDFDLTTDNGYCKDNDVQAAAHILAELFEKCKATPGILNSYHKAREQVNETGEIEEALPNKKTAKQFFCL